jgi:hypothetical protein
MKRALLIVAIALAFVLPASAQEYTFLEPPTLAVMDFEVSMSVAEKDKDTSKAYYGQLISQALLTVLVQQNAAEQVATPRDVTKDPGVPVYSAERAEQPSSSAFLWSGQAGAAAAATEVRRYFPPIFKIFDKKYVELALQNNNFTARDLYAKSVGAFSFTDLDYLVLGNVYQTVIGSGTGTTSAVGFNVRVLNTKRAEELYSYSAVVDSNLRDLPVACARIAQLIMRDILNSHCAQFVITESADVSGIGLSSSGLPGGSPSSSASLGKRYDYILFWQSRQVRKDDATVADSDDSHKRRVAKETFYWALPGQYLISVYNKDTQQIKTISFTLTSGDIRHITVEKQHLESERGTITIGGVFPTDSYQFDVAPEKQREQYWWEIGAPPNRPPRFTVEFSNGELMDPAMQWSDGLKHTDDQAVKVEYRAATNEIVIRNIALAGYDVTATAQPSSGTSGITGWWRVSSRLFVRSSPLRVDLHGQKDAKVTIADFKLQEKKVLDAPRKTKVSFLFNPGFGSQAWLEIDDMLNNNWLWWRDKEKITIESEYSQADWDALPDVSYTFYYPNSVFGGVEGLTFTRWFTKSELEPSRDTVVIIDLNQESLDIQKLEQEQAAEAQASQAGKAAQVSTAATTTTADTKTQAMAAAQVATGTVPRAKQASNMLLQLGVGIGYGSLSYSVQAGIYPNYYESSASSSGIDITTTTSVLWNLSPSFGIGLGALLHFQMSSDLVFGAAVTLNAITGVPSGGLDFVFDLGFGTGFTVGAGLAFMNPEHTSGLTMRLGFMYEGVSSYDEYINGTSYPATNTSMSLGIGWVGSL